MIVDSQISKASTSKDILVNMVNKFEDNPPAYDDDRVRPHMRSAGASTTRELVLHSSNPTPSVDQVHICESKHNIHGTFFIDPMIPVIDRRKTKHKSRQPLPHASFRSRKGSIDIELATTGNIQDAPKANVAVSTRHGEIKIQLLPTPPSRPRIGLDVQSRHGNVIFFIPEGFSGVVHLSTRKGDMQLLPALAAYTKVVKSSDNEKIFMIGTQNNVYELDPSREASFCEISTRTGSIVMGLSGRDHYTSQVGFWKRLGGYLSGSVKEKSDP
ncbi:hypothetical protein CPB84DRAFT_1770290 [Gymnopilus junonius]|uniref:DUF7330 domain-containing protein n=1 Tax=Gymnopilus junonius TaxID=109634 RepID=A0A9P5NVT0_GYMJU|nr:hypothetical protein CPB84DRAFT_1770290 [Gymnopilus junonius]